MSPQDYYTAAVKSLADAPEFGPEVTKYITHLSRIEVGETWTNFRKRVDTEINQATRGTELTSAIYPADETEQSKRFNIPLSDQDPFDTLLTVHTGSWPAATDMSADIFRQFAKLTSIWSIVPVVHDENVAEYCWSRVRCLFAGAGYELHRELAGIVLAQYPNCPLGPDETKVEWTDLLTKAHQNCGYPVHLACLPWAGLCGVLSPIAKTPYMEDWQRALGLLHVLKHCRLVDGERELVVTYRGKAACLELGKSSTVLSQLRETTVNIQRTLDIPVGSRGNNADVHPMNQALNWALNHVTVKHLLRRVSLANLPGTVLAGGWSSIDPNPGSRDGFVQHGLALTGVWAANAGRVEDCQGDDADVMGYNWNLRNNTSSDNQNNRDQFEKILPRTYTPGLPSDMFFPAFPNLETAHVSDIIALKSIFDAPIVASLLRSEFRSLKNELPIISFLPATPQLDLATNQGKTLAALTYARMLQPAVEMVGISDTSSAPDIRALADVIRNSGMACIDEWSLPKSKLHILRRENLQSLVVGMSVTAGRAGENSGTLRFTHSMVTASKALDYPPDLLNRTVAFYLSDLTNQHRADGARLQRLKTGALALEARLACFAFLEQTSLIDDFRQLSPIVGSTTDDRFELHRLLAKLIYMHRTGGKPENGAIDRCGIELANRLENHYHDAEDNGVLTSLDEGVNTRLRLSAIFADLTETDVYVIKNLMEQRGFGNGNSKIIVSSVGSLIEARLEVASLPKTNYADVLRVVGGRPSRAGNRVISQALADDVRRQIPQVRGTWPLPGHLGGLGWILVREKSGESLCVRLEKIKLAPDVAKDVSALP